MASYPRQIPAGGEGKISVKVNTNGYGGKTLKKKISIHTDDTKRPVSHLFISGNVKLFCKISPRYARLSGEIGSIIQTFITIKKEAEYPFSITKVTAKSGKDIQFRIDEYKKPGESGYILSVKNIKKETGRYADTLTLYTDSKVKPIIKIGVYGFVSPSADKQPLPPEKKKS